MHSMLAANPDWLPRIALLLAVILGAVTLEGLALHFVWHRAYDWRAYATTLADVSGRRLLDATGISLAAPLLGWVYRHRLGSFDLRANWQWLVLLIGLEFMYYWYHRAAHRVRWFWATHRVHHSPNQLTLAAALRLGWMGKFTGNALFFVPLIWLGFSPLVVLGALAVNLLYQFWLHATWIPKLGPLEWLLNTPSHHRAHHGCNPDYLDCNYGGVLIVFDRLFGTFVAEREDIPPRYGLTDPVTSYNPLRIEFDGWLDIGRDIIRARSLHEVWQVLAGPPESDSQPSRHCP